jgi:hypothetical protein
MPGYFAGIAAQSGIRGVNGRSSICMDRRVRRREAAENVEEATLCSSRRARTTLRAGAAAA